MSQPYTWIEIDTLALTHNVRTIREYIGEGIRLLGVIKSNAYGHGFSLVAETLWRSGVDYFVVTGADDALYLAEKYPKTPTLLLTPPAAVDIAKLIERDVHFAGVSADYIELLKNTARRYDTKVHIHLEIDTGMRRFGVTPEEALHLIREHQQGSVYIEALMTHIYEATNDAAVEKQLNQMQQLLFVLQQEDIALPWVHVASGSGFAYPQLPVEEILFDGVRAGRILYGQTTPNLTTRPALTWKTRIVELYDVKVGQTISYDATHTVDRDKTIAVLPIGYFDGVDRRLSNKGTVLIQGKRCAIVGRVCMNHLMVDVSPVMRPQVGDEVVLIGSQGEETLTATDMAQAMDTIDYEVLVRLPHHIPRIKVR